MAEVYPTHRSHPGSPRFSARGARVLYADLLAAVAAAVLPWSTTGFVWLLGFWLVSLIPLAPTLDLRAFWRLLASPICLWPWLRYRCAARRLRRTARRAGDSPSDPHHLRFAQPRALGRKTSDEFTVPLCRTPHRQNHQVGNEVAWWKERRVDPIAVANRLWAISRGVAEKTK